MTDATAERRTHTTPLTGYPSVDKPWLKYYSEEAINAPLPACTIYAFFCALRAYWEKPIKRRTHK